MSDIYTTLTPMLLAYNNGITTVQRNAITNPLPSTTIYNTDTSQIEIWDGTQWNGLGKSPTPIETSLPASPNTGDQIFYNHTATGNVGSLLNMTYDGTKWRPVGSAVLCRWDANTTASQTISTTTHADITMNDYNTITFTPPFTGYYEVGQTWFRWELNSGIGMSTYFSATDGSEHYRLYYTQDWNGPYQHWRAGVSCPIVVLLNSSKTYRFTANLTYASGNTGLLVCSGGSGAYVKALST